MCVGAEPEAVAGGWQHHFNAKNRVVPNGDRLIVWTAQGWKECSNFLRFGVSKGVLVGQ